MIPLVKKIQEPVSISKSITNLFLLHGYGSNAEDLFGLAPSLPQNLRIISFQAPYDLTNFGMNNSYAWFPLHLKTNGDIGYELDSAKKSVQIVQNEIMKEINSKKGSKSIVLGFSQGAMIAHALGIQNPKNYLGIAALSGRMVPELFTPNSKESLKEIKIFISHGQFDDVITIENADAIEDWYIQNNVKPTFKKYPMGHEINQECLSDLNSWLYKLLD